MTQPEKDPDEKPVGALQMLSGVFAAMVGVRSSKRRGQDLSKASTGALIVAFLIFVALLYGAMRLFVHLVKSSAGL